MMDNARHLSSPSPTSPFLFHHSERSFKSSSLTPLLSSTVDVTSADDCFSSGSSSIVQQNHSLFTVDNQQHPSLVDTNQTNHQRHSDQCVIDQDSLTGVDGDDGMHNMLSGSSTSSTSTIPLLTESHSHHSFSRISLEEYSPLTLVEDCDNVLPISPTSIACGSHHSFKSSLNGLKMENLVGDGGLHDHDVHDDVNDARSLSPNLLSASASNHNNLWSNSSTAITQNVALLNGTSASLLLSQHHHQQQINSLMQQLEPQSLDEPPPLVSQSTGIEPDLISTHRPSSEPPPGIEVPKIDVKCPQLKAKHQSSIKSTKTDSKLAPDTPTQSPSRARRNRNRSKSKPSVSHKVEQDKTNESNPVVTKSIIHDTKLHLQLNHHKKLQELQQRLFGTVARQEYEVIDKNNQDNSTKPAPSNPKSSTPNKSSKKDEPDSSAESQEDTSSTSQTQESRPTNARPTRGKRIRKRKNEATNATTSSQTNSKQTGVTAETAEPDTTTKTSDCIKLADLLSNTHSEGKTRFSVNGLNGHDGVEGDNGERRVQQIQVQVSPSLTVVTNNGLVQPIGIQQQSSSGTVITTTGATYSNQILCRTQSVVPGNGQLKGVVSNSELLKGVDNWTLQTGNATSGGLSGASGIAGGQPIGTHQIAIQVICQDGTSLVLPVSSTAGLNAAVSLTSPHPQLQAILASNQQRNPNQILPLMSTPNLNCQQQQTNSTDARPNQFTNKTSQGATTVQTSGLAASSPTLAALLDAGSGRSNTEYASSNLNGQNFSSTNLLRKLVTGGTNDLKKGEPTLQPTTVSLANCGSLVTVRTQSNATMAQGVKSANSSVNVNGEKRIKLENVEVSNVLTCPTLIDAQGVVVSNGNEKTVKQPTVQISTSGAGNITLMKTSDSSKQSKMATNTGNRQVDPAQPFRCEHCNSTFTRLGNFTRHKKIHTVPSKVSESSCDI